MKIKAIMLALAVSGLLGFAKADNVSKLNNDKELQDTLAYFNKLNRYYKPIKSYKEL